MGAVVREFAIPQQRCCPLVKFSAVPLYPDVFAGILCDLLVGQNLLGRAIFEAERACATLAALFPSRNLYMFETLAVSGRAQPPSYLKAFSSPGTPCSKLGEHTTIESAHVSMASILLCVSSLRHLRGLFLSGTAQVPRKYQQADLWHQGSVVGRSSFSLNRPGLLRTRELGHATSPSVPHGVMR